MAPGTPVLPGPRPLAQGMHPRALTWFLPMQGRPVSEVQTCWDLPQGPSRCGRSGQSCQRGWRGCLKKLVCASGPEALGAWPSSR